MPAKSGKTAANRFEERLAKIPYVARTIYTVGILSLAICQRRSTIKGLYMEANNQIEGKPTIASIKANRTSIK
jgi:hypothetical protein